MTIHSFKKKNQNQIKSVALFLPISWFSFLEVSAFNYFGHLLFSPLSIVEISHFYLYYKLLKLAVKILGILNLVFKGAHDLSKSVNLEEENTYTLIFTDFYLKFYIFSKFECRPRTLVVLTVFVILSPIRIINIF